MKFRSRVFIEKSHRRVIRALYIVCMKFKAYRTSHLFFIDTHLYRYVFTTMQGIINTKFRTRFNLSCQGRDGNRMGNIGWEGVSVVMFCLLNMDTCESFYHFIISYILFSRDTLLCISCWIPCFFLAIWNIWLHKRSFAKNYLPPLGLTSIRRPCVYYRLLYANAEIMVSP